MSHEAFSKMELQPSPEHAERSWGKELEKLLDVYRRTAEAAKRSAAYFAPGGSPTLLGDFQEAKRVQAETYMARSASYAIVKGRVEALETAHTLLNQGRYLPNDLKEAVLGCIRERRAVFSKNLEQTSRRPPEHDNNPHAIRQIQADNAAELRSLWNLEQKIRGV